MLDPIRRKIQGVIREEKNKAALIAQTSCDVQEIHKIATPLRDMILELAQGIVEIYELSGFAQRRMIEIDPGETTDKLNDIQTQLQLLREIGRLKYIEAAIYIEVLEPELIGPMVDELSHLPQGSEKIKLLKEHLALY